MQNLHMHKVYREDFSIVQGYFMQGIKFSQRAALEIIIFFTSKKIYRTTTKSRFVTYTEIFFDNSFN